MRHVYIALLFVSAPIMAMGNNAFTYVSDGDTCATNGCIELTEPECGSTGFETVYTNAALYSTGLTSSELTLLSHMNTINYWDNPNHVWADSAYPNRGYCNSDRNRHYTSPDSCYRGVSFAAQGVATHGCQRFIAGSNWAGHTLYNDQATVAGSGTGGPVPWDSSFRVTSICNCPAPPVTTSPSMSPTPSIPVEWLMSYTVGWTGEINLGAVGADFESAKLACAILCDGARSTMVSSDFNDKFGGRGACLLYGTYACYLVPKPNSERITTGVVHYWMQHYSYADQVAPPTMSPTTSAPVALCDSYHDYSAFTCDDGCSSNGNGVPAWGGSNSGGAARIYWYCHQKAKNQNWVVLDMQEVLPIGGIELQPSHSATSVHANMNGPNGVGWLFCWSETALSGTATWPNCMRVYSTLDDAYQSVDIPTDFNPGMVNARYLRFWTDSLWTASSGWSGPSIRGLRVKFGCAIPGWTTQPSAAPSQAPTTAVWAAADVWWNSMNLVDYGQEWQLHRNALMDVYDHYGLVSDQGASGLFLAYHGSLPSEGPHTFGDYIALGYEPLRKADCQLLSSGYPNPTVWMGSSSTTVYPYRKIGIWNAAGTTKYEYYKKWTTAHTATWVRHATLPPGCTAYLSSDGGGWNDFWDGQVFVDWPTVAECATNTDPDSVCTAYDHECSWWSCMFYHNPPPPPPPPTASPTTCDYGQIITDQITNPLVLKVPSGSGGGSVAGLLDSVVVTPGALNTYWDVSTYDSSNWYTSASSITAHQWDREVVFDLGNSYDITHVMIQPGRITSHYGGTSYDIPRWVAVAGWSPPVSHSPPTSFDDVMQNGGTFVWDDTVPGIFGHGPIKVSQAYATSCANPYSGGIPNLLDFYWDTWTGDGVNNRAKYTGGDGSAGTKGYGSSTPFGSTTKKWTGVLPFALKTPTLARYIAIKLNPCANGFQARAAALEYFGLVGSLCPIDGTREPSPAPTAPTPAPTSTAPTKSPTSRPTFEPTAWPTANPSDAPTVHPTAAPISTGAPSNAPSAAPTAFPSKSPTMVHTEDPTASPSVSPSLAPTSPTAHPSASPSVSPTVLPSVSPSSSPTANPSRAPTSFPSEAPTDVPTDHPSLAPTVFPSVSPSVAPTDDPTVAPTSYPTALPSHVPTDDPTVAPTAFPTAAPSAAPSAAPTMSPTMPILIKAEFTTPIAKDNETVPEKITGTAAAIDDPICSEVGVTCFEETRRRQLDAGNITFTYTVPAGSSIGQINAITRSGLLLALQQRSKALRVDKEARDNGEPPRRRRLAIGDIRFVYTVPAGVDIAAVNAITGGAAGLDGFSYIEEKTVEEIQADFQALADAGLAVVVESFELELDGHAGANTDNTLMELIVAVSIVQDVSTMATLDVKSVVGGVETTVVMDDPATKARYNGTWMTCPELEAQGELACDTGGLVPDYVSFTLLTEPCNVVTCTPTSAPSNSPSTAPTDDPTAAPTAFPTWAPTSTPSAEPTLSPTSFPTAAPSYAPTYGAMCCQCMVERTSTPSQAPTTTEPTTSAPTHVPTSQPTSAPSHSPTAIPSAAPSAAPSAQPSKSPTSFPTEVLDTEDPTAAPTITPTSSPSVVPSSAPSNVPTPAPTGCLDDVRYCADGSGQRFRDITKNCKFDRCTTYEEDDPDVDSFEAVAISLGIETGTVQFKDLFLDRTTFKNAANSRKKQLKRNVLHLPSVRGRPLRIKKTDAYVRSFDNGGVVTTSRYVGNEMDFKAVDKPEYEGDIIELDITDNYYLADEATFKIGTRIFDIVSTTLTEAEGYHNTTYGERGTTKACTIDGAAGETQCSIDASLRFVIFVVGSVGGGSESGTEAPSAAPTTGVPTTGAPSSSPTTASPTISIGDQITQMLALGDEIQLKTTLTCEQHSQCESLFYGEGYELCDGMTGQTVQTRYDSHDFTNKNFQIISGSGKTRGCTVEGDYLVYNTNGNADCSETSQCICICNFFTQSPTTSPTKSAISNLNCAVPPQNFQGNEGAGAIDIAITNYNESNAHFTVDPYMNWDSAFLFFNNEGYPGYTTVSAWTTFSTIRDYPFHHLDDFPECRTALKDSFMFDEIVVDPTNCANYTTHANGTTTYNFYLGTTTCYTNLTTTDCSTSQFQHHAYKYADSFAYVENIYTTDHISQCRRTWQVITLTVDLGGTVNVLPTANLAAFMAIEQNDGGVVIPSQTEQHQVYGDIGTYTIVSSDWAQTVVNGDTISQYNVVNFATSYTLNYQLDNFRTLAGNTLSSHVLTMFDTVVATVSWERMSCPQLGCPWVSMIDRYLHTTTFTYTDVRNFDMIFTIEMISQLFVEDNIRAQITVSWSDSNSRRRLTTVDHTYLDSTTSSLDNNFLLETYTYSHSTPEKEIQYVHGENEDTLLLGFLITGGVIFTSIVIVIWMRNY